METAKVDIRKLQLLNDRITQCLEALNQVRLSVHGLSHTSGQGIGAFQGAGAFGQGIQGIQGIGQQPFGQGMNPLATNPYAQQGINPYAQQGVGFGGYQTGFVPGLSHTASNVPWAGMVNPVLQQLQQNPFSQQQNPFLQQQNPYLGQIPFGGAMTGGAYSGLSHSSVDPFEALRSGWEDPTLYQRVAQTFPFAPLAYPPIGTI